MKDVSGKKIVEKLKHFGLEVRRHEIIRDEKELIANNMLELVKEGYDLVLFTGGTGLSPRDVTPEAISALIDRPIPGIMEAARVYGNQFTPYAMLSRGVAGFIQNTLVLTFPGSVKGVEESINALFPHILHVFRVAQGVRHS